MTSRDLVSLIRALVKESVSTFPPDAGKSLEDYETDVAPPSSRRRHNDVGLKHRLSSDTVKANARARSNMSPAAIRDLESRRTEVPVSEGAGDHTDSWDVRKIVEEWGKEYDTLWDDETIEEFVDWFMENEAGTLYVPTVTDDVTQWCESVFSPLSDDERFAVEILGIRLKRLLVSKD